jgi:hypothetical protein
MSHSRGQAHGRGVPPARPAIRGAARPQPRGGAAPSRRSGRVRPASPHRGGGRRRGVRGDRRLQAGPRPAPLGPRSRVRGGVAADGGGGAHRRAGEPPRGRTERPRARLAPRGAQRAPRLDRRGARKAVRAERELGIEAPGPDTRDTGGHPGAGSRGPPSRAGGDETPASGVSGAPRSWLVSRRGGGARPPEQPRPGRAVPGLVESERIHTRAAARRSRTLPALATCARFVGATAALS